MKIAITGSHGLIGESIASELRSRQHEIVRMVRRNVAGREVLWDPAGGKQPLPALEGVDAVVHLAGESIAEGRWTAEKKKRIRDSRVDSTTALAESLAGLEKPPQCLVTASAIGYYGDRGSELLDEQSDAGSGFLPEVCEQWEAATRSAREAGIRVVNVRIGVVLSRHGGALQKMLMPFKLGLGGPIGNGQQYWSWIALDDLVLVFMECLNNEALSGPVNGVAPEPVTNRAFTKTLGNVLNRPTVLPMPGFAARLALGEMADGLLLASAKVVPKRLQEAEFEFMFPQLGGALKHVLGVGAAKP